MNPLHLWNQFYRNSVSTRTHQLESSALPSVMRCMLGVALLALLAGYARAQTPIGESFDIESIVSTERKSDNPPLPPICETVHDLLGCGCILAFQVVGIPMVTRHSALGRITNDVCSKGLSTPLATLDSCLDVGVKVSDNVDVAYEMGHDFMRTCVPLIPPNTFLILQSLIFWLLNLAEHNVSNRVWSG